MLILLLLYLPAISVVFQFTSTIAAFIPDRPQSCRNVRVSERDIARAFFQENLGWQRPLHFGTQPITVNVTLIVTSISEISEKDRTVKFLGHVALTWIDQFHSWAHSFPHNCIDYVVLKPGERIWIPDLAHPYSENKNNLMAHPGERIRIHSDGFTSFSPGGIISSLCEFDLSHFPFDYQKCVVRLESWKYTNQHLKLAFSQPNISIKHWHENEMWRLVSYHQRHRRIVYISDADTAYDRMEFIFMLRRKPSFYICSIVVPDFLLSLAILSIYSLPLSEMLRLHIAFTCLFAHALFQLFLTSDLPRSSDNYPLLAMFIDLQMVYNGMLILGQSFIYLFLQWSDPARNLALNSYGDVDNSKLEASLNLSMKYYGILSILGKVMRVEPPFALPFIASEKKPKGMANLIPTSLQTANSAASNSGNSQQNQIAKPGGSSFWSFCPSVFTSKNAAVGDVDGELVEPSPRRTENNQADLLTGDALPAHTGLGPTNSMNPSTPNHPRSPGAALAMNLELRTTKILLDLRRKLWLFYAQLTDRFTLFIYICCIVLTPIFMSLVSANTWRDVKK